MTLHEYRYSVLRFVPSIGREEIANVGVIVVDDADGTTAGAFLPDYGPKISALAPGFNVAGMSASINTIRDRLDDRRGDSSVEKWIHSTEQLRVLAGAMKNQLQLSEPKPWRAESLARAAEQLYDLHVRPIDPAERAVDVRTVAS